MNNKKTRGFSLTELAVATAITTVLVGLTVPALGQVKKEARKITCMSNLRQLGIGYRMFLTENEGKFPIQEVQPKVLKGWVESIKPYVGRKQSTGNDKLEDVDIKSIFFCPDNKNAVGEATTFPNLQTSYATNYHCEDYGPEMDGGGKHKELDVKHPSNFIVLMDMCSDTKSRWFGDLGGSPKYKKCFIHQSKANCLMLDGHVEGFASTQLGVANTTVLGSWPDMWYHHDDQNMN